MLTLPEELSFLCVARKGDRFFRNFFGHPELLRMCGDPPYFLVRVSLSPEGLYWGWWEPNKKKVSLIYPSKELLSICFPYSLEKEEERGVGRAVQLDVSEVRLLTYEEEGLHTYKQISEIADEARSWFAAGKDDDLPPCSNCGRVVLAGKCCSNPTFPKGDP